MTTFAVNDNSVVVIIGSGASGGTLANELAQQAIDVVCLEAGPRLETKDFVNNEAEMFPKLTWLDERVGKGDSIPSFPMWTCKAVGGTTMHWTAACPRLQPHEMRARSTYGELAGASLVDWPITAAEIAPFYDRAEDQLGVTGTHGIERLPGNNNYQVLEAAAKAVGYKDVNTNNMAINSAPRNGRPGCLQLGFCTSGCVIGAKWSPLYGEIPAAEATGHFELRANSMAVRITHDNRGRANAVEYLDATGARQTQQASAVCVAANVADTTRLLLLSSSGKYPRGLANSSGLVGHNYMHHEHVTLCRNNAGHGKHASWYTYGWDCEGRGRPRPIPRIRRWFYHSHGTILSRDLGTITRATHVGETHGSHARQLPKSGHDDGHRRRPTSAIQSHHTTPQQERSIRSTRSGHTL